MWFLIGFALSLILPINGVFISLFHGVFGRLYILYWVIRYSDVWMPWIKNIFIHIN